MAKPKPQIKKLSYTLEETKAATGLNRWAIWRLLKKGILQRVIYPGAERSVFIDAASIEALHQRGKEIAVNGETVSQAGCFAHPHKKGDPAGQAGPDLKLSTKDQTNGLYHSR